MQEILQILKQGVHLEPALLLTLTITHVVQIQKQEGDQFPNYFRVSFWS